MWVAWTVPAVWLLLAVIDRVVKRKGRQRYRLFLERYGLSVSLGRIQFYTNRVNHLLVRFSDFFPRRWLQAWFTVGVVIGLVLIPLSVGVLVFTLRSFIVSSDEEARDPLLVPVLPGVNLPWSQLVYFLVTIAVSGVLHELGHAVAAVRYLISMSSALAILNSVPVYYLDGQWIFSAAVDTFFKDWSEEIRTKLTSGILMIGTVLLVLNVILGLTAVLNVNT